MGSGYQEKPTQTTDPQPPECSVPAGLCPLSPLHLVCEEVCTSAVGINEAPGTPLSQARWALALHLQLISSFPPGA